MELRDKPGEVVNALTSSCEVVKLISTDDQMFFMNKDVAMQSKHLANQLNSSFKEGQTHEIKLDLPSNTLETVVKYLHYRIINADLELEERAEFDLDPDEALNVLNAAIYLQC